MIYSNESDKFTTINSTNLGSDSDYQTQWHIKPSAANWLVKNQI